MRSFIVPLAGVVALLASPALAGGNKGHDPVAKLERQLNAVEHKIDAGQVRINHLATQDPSDPKVIARGQQLLDNQTQLQADADALQAAIDALTP